MTFYAGEVNPANQIGTGMLSAVDDQDEATFSTSTLTVSGSPYAITAVYGGDDDDEDSTSNPLSQTITPAPLTVTAEDPTKVYGAALPALTYTHSELVNGDTASVFSGALATTGTAASGVGSYPISQGTLTAGSNYSISFTPGTLTVTTATLTVEADSPSKAYGAAPPVLTYTHSELVNGDTASVFSGALATTGTAASGVGSYPISQGTLTAGRNYNINFTPGTLTVDPVALTITADSLYKAYGAALPTLTYTPTGLVNGDTSASLTTQPTLTTTAIASSPVDSYTITASGAVDANYTITYVVGTLTIFPVISLSLQTLPVATVGVPYSQQLTASGGSGRGYGFTATGLPAGLSLSSLGLLSGTPTSTTGLPFMVNVLVTDGAGDTGGQIYPLTVKAEAISGTIVSSMPQSYFGEDVTLTATFSATAAGSAPMTGTVAFYNGNTYLGTEPLITVSPDAVPALTAVMDAHPPWSPGRPAC